MCVYFKAIYSNPDRLPNGDDGIAMVVMKCIYFAVVRKTLEITIFEKAQLLDGVFVNDCFIFFRDFGMLALPKF